MGKYYVNNIPMFELTRSGPEGGDCCAPYDVEILWPKPTVGEFIDAVVRAKVGNGGTEWGYIGIHKHGSIFGEPLCEYQHGKIVSDNIPDNIKEKRIHIVTANGGWSRMDYRIYLHP